MTEGYPQFVLFSECRDIEGIASEPGFKSLNKDASVLHGIDIRIACGATRLHSFGFPKIDSERCLTDVRTAKT